MRRSRLSRRRLLEGVGLAAVGGLAGCSTDDSSTPTANATRTPTATPTPAAAMPAYADFVPSGDDPVLFTAFDLAIEGGRQIASVPSEPSDPLRYGSVAGAYVEFLTGTFMQYLAYPFEASRLDTLARERTLNVNGMGIQQLPVDLSGALADADEHSGAEINFEADDRAVITGSTGTPFGLTTDALVFPVVSTQPDVQGAIRAIVDTRTGAVTPRHEADDAFATLLSEGDTTGSVACGYAPESDLATMVSEGSALSVTLPTTGFEAASGALFHVDLDNGSPPQPASATVRYPEDATVDTESLSTVGSAARNRELTRDGRTVRVTGEYSWDALGEFTAAGSSGA